MVAVYRPRTSWIRWDRDNLPGGMLRRCGLLDNRRKPSPYRPAMGPATMQAPNPSPRGCCPVCRSDARRLSPRHGHSGARLTPCSSVNVIPGRSGPGQRQTRIAHSSLTGRPKHGVSWSRTCRRPCPTATTAQSNTHSLGRLHVPNQAGPSRRNRADTMASTSKAPCPLPIQRGPDLIAPTSNCSCITTRSLGVRGL